MEIIPRQKSNEKSQIANFAIITREIKGVVLLMPMSRELFTFTCNTVV